MNKYSRNCDNPLGYVTRRLKTHDIKQCKCFSCRHKPLRRIRPIKIHEFVCSTVINTYIKTNPLILRLFEQQNKKITQQIFRILINSIKPIRCVKHLHVICCITESITHSNCHVIHNYIIQT